MKEDKKLADKINSLLPRLNEEQKRIYLATESIYMGRGGKAKIEKLIGVSHNTINKGLKDLKSYIPVASKERIRKEGGGRKKKITAGVWMKMKAFIEPHTRGEPESPLQWVSKSLRNIEKTLKEDGINISHRIIGEALKEQGFSLQSNRKTFEGKGHQDRDGQFEFINRKVNEFFSENQPVISVDAKKRSLSGNLKTMVKNGIRRPHHLK